MSNEKLEQLRSEVTAEKGLDPSLTKRLSGTTREELEADADELLTWESEESPRRPDRADLPPRGAEGRRDPDVAAIVDSIPRP